MIELKQIDWKGLFKQFPERYIKSFDRETEELIEVYDKKTGYTWFKVNQDWMYIN